MNITHTANPPLHPELSAFLFHDGPTARLQHPIVQSHWYHPDENDHLNRWLDSSKKMLEEAIAANDWNNAVFLHQRGWRIDRFEFFATHPIHASRMSDEAYWSVLGEVIVDQEDCYRQRAAFTRLLVKTKRAKSLRPLLMTPEEREQLAALPTRLCVYRGCQPFNRKGWSWTLDKEKGIWFANRRYRGVPLLLSGEVSKDDALAYFTGRGESEILVQPRSVNITAELALISA